MPTHTRKPRCFHVYALAPEGTLPSDANRLFNEFVGDRSLPLVLFHDHFIGKPGGIAMFYVENAGEREALMNAPHLPGWQVDIRPLIFSYSPSAFDEQITYTLNAYRDVEWNELRSEERPSYGHNPQREAEMAAEED